MNIDNNNMDNFDDELNDKFGNEFNNKFGSQSDSRFTNNEMNSNNLNNNDLNNDNLNNNLNNNIYNNEEYLDYLSSKYIDADLSFEEDKILRNITNQNPNLKDNFFNNIDIYQSIKEESKNIEIPHEFLNDTENLLVDKLFNKNTVLNSNIINLQNEYANFNNYDYHLDQLELLENEENQFVNQNSKTKFMNLDKISNKNTVFNKLSLVAACFLLFFVYNINEFKSTNKINSFADLNFEIKLDKEDNNSYNSLNNSNSNNSDNFNNSNKIQNSGNTLSSNTTNENLTKNNLGNNLGENIETNIDNKLDNKLKESILEDNIIISNINDIRDIDNKNIVNKNIDNNLNSTTQSEQTAIINNNNNINNSNNSNNSNNAVIPNTIILNPMNSQVVNLKNKNNSVNNSFVYEKNHINTTFKLNSSISNDLNNSRFTDQNNAIINHYAQSVAIQIDENNDIGFEFGFSDFNFDDKANLIITTEIPNNTPGSNLKEYKTVIVPVELRKNYTMYWGLGFIEKNLFKYNDLSLNSKFAFGFSNDGPQSYFRMSAKYELIKNLNLNIGLDARYMNVNLPFYVNANNLSATTALSLNYGIQYQF